MNSEENEPSEKTPFFGRRLISWPLALIGLTLAFMLVANTVSAETIDRSALQALRQSHLAEADKITRKLTDNLVDILEVLTPEQRQELQSHFDKHRGGHGGHGRRHGRWGHP